MSKTKTNESRYSDIIAQYFSHSEEVNKFDKQIEDVIRDHWKFKNISSSKSMDDILKDFTSTEIPIEPCSISEYLHKIKSKVIDHSINVSNPLYVGHMTSIIPSFHQSIAKLLNALNQNIVKVETSKVFTFIERQILGTLHRLIYNNSSSFYDDTIIQREYNFGMVVSGGTMANITSIWIARNRALQSVLGIGEKDKLFDDSLSNLIINSGYQGATVIGSMSMHYSINKLSSLLGIGYNNIIKIPLNEKGTVDVLKMEQAIIECQNKKKLIFALVGVAGTTETGRIDDLFGISELAKKHNIHFHVDAAWGGPILFSQKHRALLKGIEHADTVTICGHKQLYLPQGISFVIVKNPEFTSLIKSVARYQARQESFDLGKYSSEGSRPIMSFYLHASLHLFGQKGYAYLIDNGIELAKWLAQQIKKIDRFELMEEPATNIVVYRYIPIELRKKVANGALTQEDHFIINCVNEILQETQFREGLTFISRTTLIDTKYKASYPVIVLRAVIANPLTTKEHLIKILEDQEKIGDHVIEHEKYTFANVLSMLARQTSSIERQ